MAEEKKNLKAKKKGESKSGRFLKETVIELKKVVWPTKKQLVKYTTVVIIASALMALFITGFDSILGYAEIFLLKK